MVNLPVKPVVLLGFMGSGKSTLGKQLAALLGWGFIDLDRFIETLENKTIPEIFSHDGEEAFRKIESMALQKVLNYNCQVIAIGGGAPCQPENLNLIKEKSQSVYLKISEAQLATRLAYSNTPRPLLNGKSESETQIFIRDLLAARELFYNQADIIIESDVITADMIASRL
jgi:shikimate kinase